MSQNNTHSEKLIAILLFILTDYSILPKVILKKLPTLQFCSS